MASLRVLTCDHEGRPIQFDTWLDDLQLYLLSDSRDNVLLFDHTSGASIAPPATDDTERAHFGQHKTAEALYDAVVARYSSPATAALGRLILPYLFPELSAFATVEDLITHRRTSDARYRSALQAEDQFLALDPTYLTDDVLEKHLLVAETSVIIVGAARGTPRTPFFEGCSPSPLAPSYAFAAAVDTLGASNLSGKHRSSKGKDGKSGGGGSGDGGGVGSGGGGGGGDGGIGGSGGRSGGFGGGGGGSGGGGGGGGGSSRSGGGGSGGGRGGDVQRGGRTCGKLHTQHHCFSRLDNAWHAEFGDEAERSRWAELFRSGVDIFALDYDAILAAMYALSVSDERDCYLCVPPDPGIEAAALGASESSLPGTAPAKALHTFTLDSGASRCFFRDNTTLTPLPAPVPLRLADPSGGPLLARSSIVLPLLPTVPVEVVVDSGVLLEVLRLGVMRLGVLSLRVRSLGLLGLRVRSLGVLSRHCQSTWVIVANLADLVFRVTWSTRPVDQLAHCCRSTALVTPDPEVGSAQARTGPTTTPVDSAEPEGAEPGGTEPKGAGPGGVESEGAESGVAEPRAQQLREWFAQRTRLRSGTVGAGGSAAGGTGAGGTGATRLGGAGFAAGVGGTGGAGAGGRGGARNRGTGAGDPEAGGVGAGGAGASSPGARGTVQWRPFFVQPPPTSLPPPDSVLCQVLTRAASPTVPRLLATMVTDPLFESTAASALVAGLVDFPAACRLDYATSLVAEYESDCHLSEVHW
ncbi:unnamed protein product [Closterium sp. NIES-53]